MLLNIVSCILEETRMEILPNVPFRNKLTQSAHLSIEYAVMHICTIYFIFIFERWSFSNQHPFRYTASCKSLEDTKRGKDNHDSRIEPPLKKSRQNKIKVGPVQVGWAQLTRRTQPGLVRFKSHINPTRKWGSAAQRVRPRAFHV